MVSALRCAAAQSSASPVIRSSRVMASLTFGRLGFSSCTACERLERQLRLAHRLEHEGEAGQRAEMPRVEHQHVLHVGDRKASIPPSGNRWWRAPFHPSAKSGAWSIERAEMLDRRGIVLRLDRLVAACSSRSIAGEPDADQIRLISALDLLPVLAAGLGSSAKSSSSRAAWSAGTPALVAGAGSGAGSGSGWALGAGSAGCGDAAAAAAIHNAAASNRPVDAFETRAMHPRLAIRHREIEGLAPATRRDA